MAGDAVVQELQKIQDAEGMITPEKTLEVARNEGNPLHSCFNWDDSEAAEQYRLWQARQLIKSVKIVIQVDEKPSRVYNVSVVTKSGESQRGYVPLSIIAKKPELFKQVKIDALRRIRYWQNEFASFEDLTKIVNEEQIKLVEDSLK